MGGIDTTPSAADLDYCRRYLEILDGWFGHTLTLHHARAKLVALNAELGGSVTPNLLHDQVLGGRFRGDRYDGYGASDPPEGLTDDERDQWHEDHYDDVWISSSCHGGG